jgi:hypothetical protein
MPGAIMQRLCEKFLFCKRQIRLKKILPVTLRLIIPSFYHPLCI